MGDEEELGDDDVVVVGSDLDALSRAKQLVGTILSDRYRIHNLLAMGGMGAVYTGEHVHMRKRVAIKLLHPDMEGLPGLVARFEREAIVGAHVEHNNVAAARDFGRLSDGSYYLVLEFVRGATLRQLIHQGPLSVSRSVRIAKQIAAGLSAVHKRGIVHRDVAPRNIMVVQGAKEAKEKVKLIDFGFAKVPVERFRALSTQQGMPMAPSEITAPGVIFGTIGYLAPEAAAGMASVDHRSDLYALGSVLYEMLAGVPPFEAATQALLFLQHRSEPVPRIRDRAPNVTVPESVEAIALKLLAKSPKDRYASASEVVHALEDAIASHAPESRASDRSAPTEAVPLEVAGAVPPASLPRFEDVADKTPEPHEVTPEPPGSARAPASSARPRGRSALTWVAGLLVLGIVGVVVADRFVPGGLPLPLRPSRQATEVHAPESQPVKVASTTSDSAPTPSSTPEASSSALAEAPIPAPTVTEVGGRDAEAWKRIVRQAPSTLDWTGAVDGLLALAELDPTALDGSDMKAAALEASVAAGFDKARGAKLVDVLGERFGAAGVDVLYDIVTLRGGSRIATLATAVLAKPEVRARGSKAFRIAVELREAKCADKLALLDQVRADGDVRALSILSAVRSPECATAAGSCCLRDSAAVETTILELSERTRKP